MPVHVHPLGPAEEDVAGGLHHPLTLHHPLPGLPIRYCPSTSSASLDSACRLSRVCAFARLFSARRAASFASFAAFACLGPFWSFLATLAFLSFSFFTAAELSAARASWMTVLNRSSSKCAYQMSIVGIPAKSAIASR